MPRYTAKNMYKRPIKYQELTADNCIAYLKENAAKLSADQVNELFEGLQNRIIELSKDGENFDF